MTKKSKFRQFYRKPRNKKIFWGTILSLSLVIGGALGLRYYFATMAERHYNRAVRDFRNNEVDKAIAEYNIVIDKFAQTEFADNALSALGEINLQGGNEKEAIKLFTKIVEKYPAADKASHAAFRLASSEEELIRVIVLYPRSEGAEEAYIAIADIKIEEGRPDEAKKILSELPERFPEGKKFDVALFKVGKIEFNKNDFRKAAKAFLGLINNFTDSELLESAYFAYADAVEQQGDLQRTISALKQAVLYYPRHERVEEIMFNIGQMHFKLNQPEAVRDIYSQFMEKSPDSVKKSDIYATIAESYFYEEDYLKAIPEFEKAINTTSDYEKQGNYYWRIAHAYDKLGSFIQAENILNHFIRNFPDHPLLVEASYKRGRLVFSQQDYPRAVELLEAAISNHPESESVSEAQYLIGKAHFILNDYERSIEAYQKVISLYPVSIFRDDTQFGICDVFFAQGENSLARTAYLLAMDNFPTSPYIAHAYYRIGDTFRNQANFERAIDYYQLALNRFPEFDRGGEVNLWISDFFYNERNFEKALVTYQDFFNNYIEDIYRDKALFRIGRCQYEIRDFEDAAKSFSRLLEEFSPGEYEADAMYYLADSFYQQDDFLNSSQYYDQASEKFPDYINRYFQNGRSEQFLRLYDRAIENYRSVASSDYNDKKYLDAQYRIGYLMLEKGETDKARAFLRGFIRRHPDSKYVAAASAKIGDVFFFENDYPQALEWYEKAQKAGKLVEDAKSRMAFSYYQEKSFDEAEKTYQELVSEAVDEPRRRLDYQTKLADSLFAELKFTEALALYEEVIKALNEHEVTDESIQWAYYQKGSTLRELRDFDEAEKTFVYLTQTFPEGLWAEQAAQEQLTVRWQKRQSSYFPERT